jgi:RNA polymerase sigma factor (sigma-70 family)
MTVDSDPVTPARLFERYHLAVYRYFRRITGQRDLAQDLTQDVFLRIVRDARGSRGLGRDAAWVFAIARHVLADHRRRTRPADRASGDAPEPVGHEAPQLLAFGIAEALDLLPEADREVLVLREVGGFTYLEIAGLCETTVESVRVRLFRARGRMRRYLAGERSARRSLGGQESS